MTGVSVRVILVILFSLIQLSSSDEPEDRYLLFDGAPFVPPSFMHGSLNTLDRLVEWATYEENIVRVLEQKYKLLEMESKLINSYIKDYNESTKASIKGLHDISKDFSGGRGKVIGSSAVLAHRMTDRLTSTLADLQKLLSSGDYTENQRNVDITLQPKIVKLMKELEQNKTGDELADRFREQNIFKMEKLRVWPKFIDKFMSDLAFIHIHEVYGFYPEKMRIGLPIDTEYGGVLNAKQCTSIGVHALSRKYYFVAIEWLELAKTLLISATETDSSISLDLVSALIDIAIQEHNLGMKNVTYFDIANYFNRPTYEGQQLSNRIRARQMIVGNSRLRQNVELNLMSQYSPLCSGFTLQTPEIQKTLKCFYDNKKHPYLYINPVKTEILSENPPLYQFYEVLTNHSMEIIKKTALPKVELSLLIGVDDDNLDETTRHRTSAGSWFRYEELPKLYEHSEIVSGLKLLNKTSEMAQVVEYTYGKYYIYHTDAIGDLENVEEPQSIFHTGDRVATLLYYVEPGVYGGDTPFCAAGVNARPVRGSAILWYNMFRNGTVRSDVHHGACPVIHGHKIIINHWIRYNGNWNRYKCSLNQFE